MFRAFLRVEGIQKTGELVSLSKISIFGGAYKTKCILYSQKKEKIKLIFASKFHNAYGKNQIMVELDPILFSRANIAFLFLYCTL